MAKLPSVRHLLFVEKILLLHLQHSDESKYISSFEEAGAPKNVIRALSDYQTICHAIGCVPLAVIQEDGTPIPSNLTDRLWHINDCNRDLIVEWVKEDPHFAFNVFERAALALQLSPQSINQFRAAIFDSSSTAQQIKDAPFPSERHPAAEVPTGTAKSLGKS